MPKKIDHEQYRLELASKAADIFSQHGFSGLGMRQIAAELGVSKSALYHYFPSKQALFNACADVVTNFDEISFPQQDDDSIRAKVKAIVAIFKEKEPSFPNEISLLLDYLRGRSTQEIAEEANMKLTNKRYEELVGHFVDEQDTKPVLCMLLGTLLMRFLDGGTTDFEEIEQWLTEKLEKSGHN